MHFGFILHYYDGDYTQIGSRELLYSNCFNQWHRIQSSQKTYIMAIFGL